MILHVLDTDHVSLFQRKHPTVLQNLVSADPNFLAVSQVGWFRGFSFLKKN
jgi:hypothetical protein